MPGRDKLSEFVAWCGKNITGDEKGRMQIFLDRLFQAFGQAGSLDVGGHPEFRIRKVDEHGGGTAFFDTFPWPQTATVKQIDAVAAAARELRRVRAEALPKMKGGLRARYRTLEWTRSRPLARPSRACCCAKLLSPFPKRLKCPGANRLKDAHAALDAAVLTAYGLSAKKDLLAQLLALNQQVAAKIEKREPVTAPGVPPNCPDAEKLVTDACVRPNLVTQGSP